MIQDKLGEQTEAVRVVLFDREYAVRGHGNRKYIERLAEFIRNKADDIQKKTKVVSTLDIAILTLLNVTDELFEYKRAEEERSTSVEGKTRKPENQQSRAV